jgi:N-methylhydantoinase A
MTASSCPPLQNYMRFEARLDMRFAGQAFEVSVSVPPQALSMADIDWAFLATYERRYSCAAPGPAEIVTFRLAAYALVAKPSLPAAPTEGCAGAAKIGERPVAFDGTSRATPIYDRPLLPAGSQIVRAVLVGIDRCSGLLRVAYVDRR